MCDGSQGARLDSVYKCLESTEQPTHRKQCTIAQQQALAKHPPWQSQNAVQTWRPCQRWTRKGSSWTPM